jgi:hypothetical protein
MEHELVAISTNVGATKLVIEPNVATIDGNIREISAPPTLRSERPTRILASFCPAYENDRFVSASTEPRDILGPPANGLPPSRI